MASVTATANRKKSNGSPAVTAADIEEQLEQLRTDVTSLAKTVAAFGATKASEAKSKADKTGAEIVDTSHQAIEALNREIQDLEKQLRTRVREKPFQAIGIAAAVGFLAAFLARR